MDKHTTHPNTCVKPMKPTIACSFQCRIAPLLLLLAPLGQAQSVDSFYASAYSLRTVASIPGVPRAYGGVTIRADAPDVLLVAGNCDTPDAKIYQVTVQRGTDGHIAGFTGVATVLASTPGRPGDDTPPWTGLVGDWDYGPGNVLFYTAWDNSLSQILPGGSAPAKQVDLGETIGLTANTVVVVPAGLPGAGRFKLGTRHHHFWFDVPLTPDGMGTYNVGSPTTTIEGADIAFVAAAYVPAGTPKFSKASVVVCDTDRICTFEVDANGDPVVGSQRTFVTGLDGPDGIGRDPATGDLIFVSTDANLGFFVLGSFASGPPPTVRITQPANGAKFEAPAAVELVAEATAPGGTIARLDFFQNLTPLGTVLVPPYVFTVTGLAAGTYAYQAVVTDGIGRMATSTVVAVTVTNPPANILPSVALSSPTNSETFSFCSTISLAAVASDPDGVVTSVAFFDGSTLLGTVSAAPYRLTAVNLAGGAHALAARATDNDGGTRTSDVVNVMVAAVPLHTLLPMVNTRHEWEACFTGIPGTNYVLTRMTHLNFSGTWAANATRVATNTSPTGVMRFVDPSSTNYRTLYYRAEPAP